MPAPRPTTSSADHPLRIAWLVYRGNPHCGGQGVYTRYLARELTDLGHEITVFSGQPYPELDDPSQLAKLPPAIELGIRHGLADALHPVFLAGVPIIAVAFIATLFIKELPLRQTVHVTAGRPTDS